MDLLKNYIDYIQQNGLFGPADKLLLAVSGGIDSVVLVHLSKAAGHPFGLAHCNFGLRGEESERDEAFVRELAATLVVPLYIRRFDTRKYAEEHKVSIQVAARELRYSWFREILDAKADEDLQVGPREPSAPYQYLVTAHHRDDNIETVFMNFCKGTGITGLRGMQPRQDRIVRPLLFASREDIADYAKQHQLSWVEDSSNDETKYTRNYFRKMILPAVEKTYPQVRENIANNIDRYREVAELYDLAVELQKKKMVEVYGAEVRIPVLKLAKSSPRRTLIYEIVKEYGFTARQAEEVEKLLSSESGRYINSPTHRLLRNRSWLVITPLEAIKDEVVVVNKEEMEALFNEVRLHLEWLEGDSIKFAADQFIAALDAREIQFPLIIRRWKEGDYFYPLGLRKKKKLSRFFIDQKLSKNDKEKVWVVESHKKIVWVIGYRIDDRFKITPSTTKVLQLSISSL
ncbi:MAG TPA: tRNA lysidine(34) synthetase TilS [Chitinophagaceae bacterium]